MEDLDRCSPRKTLEVLESIKVFLGMEGFIYVIGLSHDIVTKLIDIEYKETGVKGEHYIRKIIQIPITLPKWDNKDITKLIQDFKDKELIHKKYQDLIDQDLISLAVENNPRDVKRFLNNFIIAFEIFNSIGNFKANELLLMQVIQLRWNSFYDLLMKFGDKKFRIELEKYIQMDEDIRLKTLESDETEEDDGNYVLKIRRLLSNHKTDSELWNFLTKNSETMSGIVDLTIYRRATEVGIEPALQKTTASQDAYDLLRNGKTDLFNRRVIDFGILDLAGVDLLNADLNGVNLTNANLMNAKLAGTNLMNAKLAGTNLSGANLAWANLTNADLTEANLQGANLRGTSLIKTKLEEANLTRANLINVNFNGANLIGANLSNSTIIRPIYDKTTKLGSDTIFSDAFIDGSDFVDFTTRFTNHVPKNKE